MKTRNIAAFLAVSLSVFSATAVAQNYPAKPIQLVVGYPAGGNTDSIARRLVQDAKEMLGWEIVVVNKVGGGGVLGMQYVADAQPDGYTLGLATSSGLTNAPWVMDIPKDLIERSTALVWLGRPQTGIAVRSESPIRNFQDMIEQARRNPDKISIGLQGKGSGIELGAAGDQPGRKGEVRPGAVRRRSARRHRPAWRPHHRRCDIGFFLRELCRRRYVADHRIDQRGQAAVRHPVFRR